MDWLAILFLLIHALVLALAVTTCFAYLTWFERRLLARFQHRIGPNRAGPQGLLQPVADAVKLFFKEDTMPNGADRWVYLLAPAMAVIPAIIIWAVMPLGCWNMAGDFRACFDPAAPRDNLFQFADINVGMLYILAVTSIAVYGITLAGWASNSKYSMLGGIRSSAQLISYELALGTAVLCAIMSAGTFSTRGIVDQQFGLWTVVPGFLAFVVFMISSTAEVVRAPFDLVEAEQEIAGGYMTEYGSMRFALFFMTEYIKLIAICAIATMLFLGGWQFPGLYQLGVGLEPLVGTQIATAAVGIVSLLSFLGKVVVLLFISVWLRASLPRFRYDQLMDLGWKWLLPLSLIAVTMTAVVIVLVPDNKFVQTAILFVVGVIVLWITARLGTPKKPEKVAMITSQRVPEVKPETAS